LSIVVVIDSLFIHNGMSYPKIMKENLYALNKEKKFESRVPKMNFLSENRKWKKWHYFSQK